MTFDLFIHGGEVVTESGTARLDIGVVGGTIAALVDPHHRRDVDAAESVDATGLLVVPGGIDPHVHCNWPILASAGGEPGRTGGPDVVSMAAAYGGTTTLIDFAVVGDDGDVMAAIERHEQQWTGQSYSDYSFHVLVQRRVSQATLDQISHAVSAGFTSVKVFTSNVRPGGHGRMVPFGYLPDVMRATRDAGGIVAVHAEDDDIVMRNYERHLAEGKVSLTYMPDVHSALSEGASFARVLAAAEVLSGPPLYFMHVSSAVGVDMIERARERGMPVFGEVLPQYALHTAAAYAEPDGMKHHTYPSLRHAEDAARLWSGVESGTLSVFATDELCTTYEVKTRGSRIDDVTGGNSGIETRMSLLYTELVCRRGMSLSSFVAATSTNAAKIFGMYPRKGVIQVGSDADLALLDTNRKVTITNELVHETDYTPWEGWTVEAWPSMTVRRGEVLVRDAGARLVGAPAGRLVPRKP